MSQPWTTVCGAKRRRTPRSSPRPPVGLGCRTRHSSGQPLNPRRASRSVPAPRATACSSRTARALAAGGAGASREGEPCVLTAHHADDQAETVLMRLGRGSGLSGLAGMRRETSLGIRLVRPLLAFSKRDLVAVCHRAGQAFRDDPSNADPTFARVRLRAQVDARDALGLDTRQPLSPRGADGARRRGARRRRMAART